MSFTTQESEFLTALGSRIKEARKERGWSQEKLAQLSGLHRTYVGLIEVGKRNVAIINLSKILDALEVDVEEIYPRRHKAD